MITRGWMRRPDASRYRCLVLVVAVLLIGLPTLVYPFGRDQGEYAYIATAALAGKAIYREVFNVKPPLTHALHALALLLFGRSMLAIRLLDLLWQAATALVVMQIARRTVGRRWAGVGAGLLYALGYYLFDFWSTAQTDGFLTLPTALAVWAFMAAQEEKRVWAFVASGAALGAAALFKYPIGALLPMLLLLSLWPRRRGAASGAVGLAVGFLVPVGLCLAALAAQGALGGFFTTQLRYVPQYTGQRDFGAGYLGAALRVVTLLSWPNLMLWPGVLLAGLNLYLAHRQRRLRPVLPILLWWLAAVTSYVLQLKGFVYHALPILAPQAILVVQVLPALKDRRLGRPARYGALGLANVLVLMPIVGCLWRGYPLAPAGALARVLAGRQTLAEAYRQTAIGGSEEPGFSLAAQMDAAAYIRAHTAPGDAVFIWGFEPAVYFLSGRECASRFIYNFPLYGDWAWPELRAQLVADLSATPPVYIVVVRDDVLQAVTGTELDSAAALAGFPWLAELIDRGYALETSCGNLDLYRRR